MSTSGIKPTNQTVSIAVGEGALAKYFKENGGFPKVTVSIFPLQQTYATNLKGTDTLPNNKTTQLFVDKFISYSFNSSVIVPVTVFQCEFYYEPINGIVKPQSGDIIQVSCNGIPIMTGMIDQTDMETDGHSGTRLTLQGRNLLGQWEDQDAVSLNSQIMWSNNYSILQVVRTLGTNTRVSAATMQTPSAPQKPYLFATQPGESKISAFQRYCEALDILFWMDGLGNLIVGKPDMYGARTAPTTQGSSGEIYLLKSQRASNVLAMRSTQNPSQIPNMILPIWNGQENVQTQVSPNQFLKNASLGPARLLNLGHVTPKTVIVSIPNGADPQELAEINSFIVAGQSKQSTVIRAGENTILQVYAKRAMAKANLRDLNVISTMAGHCDSTANPYLPDRCYHVQYDIDNIDEKLYLYEVDYSMTEAEGQRTRLNFCRSTAIVSNVVAL